MRDRIRSGKTQLFLLLTVFVVIIAIVGLLMRGRMQLLLHRHLERQTARQAETLAELVNEKLESEITNLENIAVYLQMNATEVQSIMAMAQQEDTEAVWGILDLDRKERYENGIDASGFQGIQHSFRGNSAVSYKEENGLLFTVPVYNNGNVKYVLYKFVEEQLLYEKFGVYCYEGEGRALVANREEQIVIPDGNRLTGTPFWQMPDIENIFVKISEKMNIASSAAVFFETEEPMYVFVAEIGEWDELLLVGMVPEEVADEGVSYIIKLVLWVFGLLLLLLTIGMAFLFGAVEKAKESEELRRAKEVADMANQAKTNFLASMSHEIRTPINAVMGMNEMILRECEDEAIREYAFNVQSASRTLLSLINDILDLSKIEAGKMEIVNDNYKLSAVLYDVANMIQIKTEQKQLAFSVEVDEGLPDNLYGDEVRIRQVIVNILNNAVKYTKEGSVSLKVMGEKNSDDAVNLVFSVSDTGIGIREEDMDKLYGAFERLDQKENHSVEGTGLGLSITTRMLELMHGHMEVESIYGEGSTFRIYLPQKITAVGDIGPFEAKYHEFAVSKEEYRESFEAPDAKILVVDDNEMNLFVVTNLLKMTKMEIVCCDRGEKCLELVKQQAFDVILLDHMMPGMDGIETMKRLKGMEDNLSIAAPVIALTANAIIGVREMYLSEGFDDYLSKPIESETLEKMIKKFLPAEKIRRVENAPGGARNQRAEVSGKQESHGVAEVQERSVRGTVDLFLGLQYSAEDADMYKEFLRVFCDMSNEKAEKIQLCYKQEDWENYTVLVHALKSTSLSIGAKKLSELALELEKAGKENQLSVIREGHATMMKLYETTVKEGYQILDSDICI